MAKRNAIPKYEHHEPTNTARVRWYDADGKRHTTSLGQYDSPESKKKYSALIAGLQKSQTKEVTPAVPLPSPDGLLVTELAESFAGRQLLGYSKSEKDYYKAALKVLLATHAKTPVAEFGPLALDRVRDAFIAKGWTREHINAQVRRVRTVFRWGEKLELVPAGKFFHLKTLDGLRKGKTTAPDQREVQPVEDWVVIATLPHLLPTVQAMIRFQRLVGCRPQDVCNLTPEDIDRSGKVWVYRPKKYKTKHHGKGHERTIFIGPKAQEVILPYLDGDPAKHAFSPKRAWHESFNQRFGALKVKVRRKADSRERVAPEKTRDFYQTVVYIRAIRRGCKAAKVEKWTPNQLRHRFGTDVREEFGLEATQKAMGHKEAKTTERYAKVKNKAGESIAEKVG